MPKTKNAFGLRGFDPDRIFQRARYRDFHLDPDRTDEEILQSLTNPQADEYERSFDTLRSLYQLTIAYQKAINRHLKRLDRYSMRGGASARLQSAASEYGLDAMFVQGLTNQIAKTFYRLCDERANYRRNYFSNQLKIARRELGLNQRDFGSLLGLSQRGVSNHECGDAEPNLATLYRLSTLTNHSVDWFLGVRQ